MTIPLDPDGNPKLDSLGIISLQNIEKINPERAMYWRKQVLLNTMDNYKKKGVEFTSYDLIVAICNDETKLKTDGEKQNE